MNKINITAYEHTLYDINHVGPCFCFEKPREEISYVGLCSEPPAATQSIRLATALFFQEPTSSGLNVTEGKLLRAVVVAVCV